MIDKFHYGLLLLFIGVGYIRTEVLKQEILDNKVEPSDIFTKIFTILVPALGLLYMYAFS